MLKKNSKLLWDAVLHFSITSRILQPSSIFNVSLQLFVHGASQLHVLTDNYKQPAVGKFNFTYLIKDFNESLSCTRGNKTSHTVGRSVFLSLPGSLSLSLAATLWLLDHLDALMLLCCVREAIIVTI